MGKRVKGEVGGAYVNLLLYNIQTARSISSLISAALILSPLMVSMRRALLGVSGSGLSGGSLQTLAGAKGQGGL